MARRIWNRISNRIATALPGFMPTRAARLYRGQRVVIAGLFSRRCGLQRAADLMAIDMERNGVTVYRLDLTSIAGIEKNLKRDNITDQEDIHKVTADDIVIHAPPHIIHAFIAGPGRKLHRKLTTIAYWYWETPIAPADWKPIAMQMDEIWVPTPFVSQAVSSMAPDLSSRVRIIPTAIDADPMPKATMASRFAIREKLSIHQDAFVSGFTFSMESCFERKNPLAALAAFKQAFRSDQSDVKFILRCHDAEHYPDGHQQIRADVSGDRRVILLDSYDNYIPVREFYESIDTFVSLHRSEGFGLTIAEAEQSGARVICTGWGLAPELEAKSAIRTVTSTLVPLRDPQRLYRPSPRDFWAEPNIGQAASLLREDYSANIAHTMT